MTPPSIGRRDALRSGFASLIGAPGNPLASAQDADWRIYNVRSPNFGAVGDGRADDTSSIQAALTAAGPALRDGATVYLPPGRYRVTRTLLFSIGVRIVGGSPWQTRIEADPGIGAVFRSNAVHSAQVDAHFETLFIELSGLADVGIDLTSLSGAVLFHCWITGDRSQKVRRGVGILCDAAATSGYHNQIIACRLDQLAVGVRVQNDANTQRIIGGAILNCGTGVEVRPDEPDRIDDFVAFGTRIEGCTDYGADVAGDRARFYGCRFENDNVGVRFTDGGSTAPHLLCGNLFTANATADVVITGPTTRVQRVGEDLTQYEGRDGRVFIVPDGGLEFGSASPNRSAFTGTGDMGDGTPGWVLSAGTGHGLLERVDGGAQNVRRVGVDGHRTYFAYANVATATAQTLSAGITAELPPGIAATLRLNGDRSGTSIVAGIAGGQPGRRLRLINMGQPSITLAHASSSADPRRRIIYRSRRDIELTENAVVDLEYDGTVQRWRVVNLL